MSSNNFPYGHLVKIEWLVANVTAVGSLDRAERAILGVIVAGRVFGQFRSYLWLGSHPVVWEAFGRLRGIYDGGWREGVGSAKISTVG